MESTCYKCPYREIGCHDTCTHGYREFREKKDAENYNKHLEVTRYVEISNYLISHYRPKAPKHGTGAKYE